jgi:1-acyl-sn-glycerol-3-phosphate acyltransferase
MITPMVEMMLAAGCRLISGASVEWRCDPYTDAQRIYFGNHSSHLDFIVIWSALPPRLRARTRPVAGRDYWDQSGIRRFLASNVFRAVLIRRNGDGPAAASARAAVEQMALEMGQHDSLIVFPEGTRSVNGEIGPFKSGLFHLSRAKPETELIPVHLDNLNRILPKGEALPVPMLSRVTFGARLPTIVDEPKEEFLTRARTALLQLGATQ